MHPSVGERGRKLRAARELRMWKLRDGKIAWSGAQSMVEGRRGGTESAVEVVNAQEKRL